MNERSMTVWTERAPLPEARAEIGVAELGGEIHVLGGTLQAAGAPLWACARNTVYDPASDTWRERSPLPAPLSHAGVAVLDGLLYAVGGFLEPVHMRPRDSVFAYDPATDDWHVLPSLPEAIGSVAVAAAGGLLHVFGGRTSSRIVKLDTGPGGPELSAGFGTVSTHRTYDPRTRAWATATPVPGPARDHQGVAVLGDRVHLFGGRREDISDNLSRHDVYDTATGEWWAAAELPAPRSSGAYCVLDGRIRYVGGECSANGDAASFDAYTDAFEYDPGADAWTTLVPLPAPRHAFGAAAANGTAYFIGGAPKCGGGASTTVFALG
ncbi:Kelch repeat-containing protein [Amycolatopsis xylanica]|nr:kelch repeat-containing protein [Amycolatopsis xylanica]